MTEHDSSIAPGILDRRLFLQSSTLAAAAALAPSLFNAVSAQESPSEELNAGVIGTGRGMAHANAVMGSKGAKLKYVCDVDQKRLSSALKTVTDKGAKAEGKYIKQTGGKGQYGHGKIEIFPAPGEGGYITGLDQPGLCHDRHRPAPA